MRNAEFPPVRELVPHRGDVLLIDRVLDHDGESTTTLVDVSRQQWLKRDDGSVAPWLAMEYMAQSVAVHEGLLALAENRELPRGFLISALGLRLHATEFAARQRLHVRVRRARGRPGLGVLSHHCSVRSDEHGADATALVEGRLCVSVQNDPPANDGEI